MSSNELKYDVREENSRIMPMVPDGKCEDVLPKLKGWICYGIGPNSQNNFYCDVCVKLIEENKKKPIESAVRLDNPDLEWDDYFKYLDLKKEEWCRNHTDRSDLKGAAERYIESQHRECNVFDEPVSDDDDFDIYGNPIHYIEREKCINDAVKNNPYYGFDEDIEDVY